MVKTIKIETTTIPITTTTTILILLVLPLLPLPLPILLLRHLFLHLIPVATLVVTRLTGQSEEQPTETEDSVSQLEEEGTTPLLSADGSTLLTEKTQILQRWTEHFRGVLNRPSVISDAAIARLTQVKTNVDLDLPPSLQETIRAVQQLSSGKAPGSDAIPAEVNKQEDPQLTN
nr:unnamed protein product [Spirometra erinaceieuropaei]